MATILHVENDRDDAFFVRHALQKARVAAKVEGVSDGREAIDYLAGAGAYRDRNEHPLPDLILLDINMPGITGFEVLEWLRRQEPFRSLPVFMLSSSGDVGDRTRAKELRATGYLVKETGFQEVATTVAKMLCPEGAAVEDSSQSR